MIEIASTGTTVGMSDVDVIVLVRVSVDEMVDEAKTVAVGTLTQPAIFLELRRCGRAACG